MYIRIYIEPQRHIIGIRATLRKILIALASENKLYSHRWITWQTFISRKCSQQSSSKMLTWTTFDRLPLFAEMQKWIPISAIHLLVKKVIYLEGAQELITGNCMTAIRSLLAVKQWDGIVRCIKRALFLTLLPRNWHQVFVTIFSEAGCLLISRPLFYARSNNEDDYALTPNHFLFGRPFCNVPGAVFNVSLTLKSSSWTQVKQSFQEIGRGCWTSMSFYWTNDQSVHRRTIWIKRCPLASRGLHPRNTLAAGTIDVDFQRPR